MMRTSSPEGDDLGLALVRPTEANYMAYLGMIADFEAAGEQHLIRQRHRIAVRDVIELLRYCEADSRGLPGLVPQTLFLVVRHGVDVVGECPIRHHLTPALEDVGGHIGYPDPAVGSPAGLRDAHACAGSPRSAHIWPRACLAHLRCRQSRLRPCDRAQWRQIGLRELLDHHGDAGSPVLDRDATIG